MARQADVLKGRLRIVLILLLSLLGYSTMTVAADLVIGVEKLAYMPYYSVEKGEYHGFARELFDRFAKEKGHNITYRPLPVERLYRYLLDGHIDFKFPDNPEWRNDLKNGVDLHYSDGVVPFQDGVLVTPEKIAQPVEASHKIGTIRGFAPWPLMGQIDQGAIQLVEQNSISGLLRQTLEGRLDGVYINSAVANFHLKNILHRESALVLDKRIPHASSAYHITSINKPEIIRELNSWMLTRKGYILELQQKWGIAP